MHTGNPIKMKDILLSFILLLFSLFCSQTLCYFCFDEFIRFFTSSLVTYLLLRIVFTIFIYLFLEAFIKKTFDRRRQFILLFAYILFLLALTLKPVFLRSFNIVPFKFLNDIQIYQSQFLFFIGNFVLYIPLGIFLKFFFHKKPTKVLFIALLAIVFVELLQIICKLGICDIDDIILNFSGLLLGYVISTFANSLKNMKKEQR